jgi:hypothetical protein
VEEIEKARDLWKDPSPQKGLGGFESVLVSAAHGAGEIFGEVFEGGARGDAVIGVANGRIVFPATDVADVLAHGVSPDALSMESFHSGVFYSIAFLRALAIVEKVERTDKIAGDAADAFESDPDAGQDFPGAEFWGCLAVDHGASCPVSRAS